MPNYEYTLYPWQSWMLRSGGLLNGSFAGVGLTEPIIYPREFFHTLSPHIFGSFDAKLDEIEVSDAAFDAFMESEYE